MRKFLLILLVLLSFSLGVFSASVFAQSPTNGPSDPAKKYNITFPIEELGSCSDLASCKQYCEDPVNSTACINFAKKKGF